VELFALINIVDYVVMSSFILGQKAYKLYYDNFDKLACLCRHVQVQGHVVPRRTSQQDTATRAGRLRGPATEAINSAQLTAR
jgi:hypothetical protein